MPFGLKMSQDILQQRIDQLIEGLEGVLAIADDIIVLAAPSRSMTKISETIGKMPAVWIEA